MPRQIKAKNRRAREALASGNCSAWRPAAEYKTNSGEWWAGRRVRLLRDIRTRGGKLFRKRRIARVERKFGGLTLIGTKGLYVTRVGYWRIEVDTTPND